MLNLIILALSLMGLFAALVFIVSKVKKCSLEQAAAIVWEWIKENIGETSVNPVFALDSGSLERIFKIVLKHSQLEEENTYWENNGFSLKFQIIPRDERSITAAAAEIKVFILNIAKVSGCSLDVEIYDEPYMEQCRILVVFIAVTEEQRAIMADYRQKKAHMSVIDASSGLQPFTDDTLQSYRVMLGFDAEYKIPIYADFEKIGHLCLVGGTGSGKSVATLYILYNLLALKVPIELYIGDFKKSGDYANISSHFVEADEVPGMIDEFYQIFENTPEGYKGLKILLLDEYAGLLTKMQQDKKRADDIRSKITNLLMLGRSRHCYVWCIQQRITATLFAASSGAIDNFQISLGMGHLSPDSRRALFAGEWPEDSEFIQAYQPTTGQGIIFIDGQQVRPFAIPRIDDKKLLLSKIQQRANERP